MMAFSYPIETMMLMVLEVFVTQHAQAATLHHSKYIHFNIDLWILSNHFKDKKGCDATYTR